MVPRAGFEPAALSLEVSCSIQLSYRGKRLLVRVRRIELRSRVWKTRILTAVLHPRAIHYIITLVYNKSMGRLFDRFSTNSTQSDAMHSSGLTNNKPQVGGRIAKNSFQRRQNTNRQYIGAYKDSGVRHAYRKAWQDQQIAAANANGTQITDSRQPQSSRVSDTNSQGGTTQTNKSSLITPTTEPDVPSRTFTEPIKPSRDPFNR